MLSRHYALKELWENGVNSLPITTEQIEDILTSKGFKIINYDVSCKEHADILKGLGVLQLASRTKAFTYVNNQEKIVFIKIGISANEKRLLLAHELGHIAMGHISDKGVIGYHPSGLIDEGQEDEANAFALEFLAPVCVLSRKHIRTPQMVSALTLLDEKRSRLIADEIHNYTQSTHLEAELCRKFEISGNIKKFCTQKIINCTEIILIISVIIFVLFCVPTTQKYSISANTTEQSVATNSSETSECNNAVYVTKSGSKFHKRNCRHIKNSSTILEIPYNDVTHSGYEPCKDCFSELYF